eukprot:NODE_9240_length_609_cov_34.806584_g8608_i0.p1 GENE.NODE_9240_length_609_cov_34.806584_g8608_i0~~NODE_9240_length_609_cov_34.806584_g8608_i0.p1  ORF type:complete len:167 (+),score=37.48 NODE_9240_length_609_cov_34.806584_g8608_i0:44-502(+)
MSAFGTAFKQRAIVGKTIPVEILRDPHGTGMPQRYTVNLTIVAKKREVIEDLPPLLTVSDLQAVLEDPVKLAKVSLAAFSAADDDLSGLVTRKEFCEAMQDWLRSAGLSRLISREELQDMFDRVDVDRSGYLTRSEFPPVIEAMLLIMVQHC